MLDSEELLLLQPHVQPVRLVLEQVLYEAGEPIDHVHFIESGIVAITADTGDTSHVEVGMRGREGMVGASVILAREATAIHRAMVQVPGSALRVRTGAFRDVLDRVPAFRDRCLQYMQVLMMQSAQTAACNARHEMTERLARWLLMSRDRLDCDELPMTQEFIGLMLGVRRAGVSLVANTLQSTGAIRQLRGRLSILDRAALEGEACNCYRFIEDSRKRIMGASRLERSPAKGSEANLASELAVSGPKLGSS